MKAKDYGGVEPKPRQCHQDGNDDLSAIKAIQGMLQYALGELKRSDPVAEFLVRLADLRLRERLKELAANGEKPDNSE